MRGIKRPEKEKNASHTMCVVLVSDTSKEFPKNTNSAFKVQLPEPLQLEDRLWEVALSSVSLPDAGLNLDALTNDRTANLIEAAFFLDSSTSQLKWATVSLADLDPFTITDGVELMKVITDQIQWIQTWNRQLSFKKFWDAYGPGFAWDDLVVTRRDADIVSLHSTYKLKIRRAFAIVMGWWVYNASKKWWELRPNLLYGIRREWLVNREKRAGYKSIRRSVSNDIQEDSPWLQLKVFVNGKFSHLRYAMAKAVGQPSLTLLMHSDVVRSNVVGDMEQPLVVEVPYKCHGSGSTYFEPLQVQWIPLRRLFLDVVEVQLAESS